MNKKEKKAIDLIGSQPSIKFPWHVGRFFVDGSRQIDFSNDQASLGEDFGTLDELREVLNWLVDQFGGKITWSKNKK